MAQCHGGPWFGHVGPSLCLDSWPSSEFFLATELARPLVAVGGAAIPLEA